MLHKVLRVTLLTSVIIIVVMFIFRGVNDDITTYVEVEYSIYKIPNQCIADYYFNDLTADGYVFSRYPIVLQCNGIHLQESIVKIYNDDGPQQAQVNAYKLHGLLIKLDGNATFMNKVILRRLDNGKFLNDITEEMKKDFDNPSEAENTSV